MEMWELVGRHSQWACGEGEGQGALTESDKSRGEPVCGWWGQGEGGRNNSAISCKCNGTEANGD